MDWKVKAVRNKRVRLDVKRMTYVMGFLALVCLGIIFRQGWSLFTLREEVSGTDRRLEVLQQEKSKLQREKQALGRLEHVEKVAREDYNMVKKDEIPIFILEGKTENK